MQVQYPMMFELRNASAGTFTHVGTLEFSAAEGRVHAPAWLMNSLGIPEGGIVTVTNKSLPKATWVKLQPQHKKFLDLSNPKAVLERVLQNYSCLTKGKIVSFQHIGQTFELQVEEIKPAVSVTPAV